MSEFSAPMSKLPQRKVQYFFPPLLELKREPAEARLPPKLELELNRIRTSTLHAPDPIPPKLVSRKLAQARPLVDDVRRLRNGFKKDTCVKNHAAAFLY